ncbi:MAG: outer membrane protein transport protein [Gammaproteobacteria bacterium]|nr:outer membrane protein transport protein [Gammaproteobacteria bacterium]MBU1647080.1 outer membrane protein transport protein [Gammaproteobacteria bacterium]MBU1972592.1 outer membrane protein transport protein [Gammaproteobacteria bacterium]
MKLKKIAALLAVAGLSAPAFATNGMNLPGYGPVAAGMGGASMAYDNGNAGLINNPATLGLRASGTSRVDIAVGGLHPDVSATSTAGAGSIASSAKEFYMPAMGYVRKDGKVTWGIGMMSQGGMGTDFGRNSWMSGGSGLPLRTELGVGRVLFPLVFSVTDTLTVGGTFDYVWGGLDMQSMLSAAQFGGMGGTTTGGLNSIGLVHFDFNKGTDKFSQALTTSGTAVNLGFTWAATPQLSIGGVYHSKTSLGDMSGNGTYTSGTTLATGGTRGTFKLIDFQWPETYGLGISYQATDRLQLVLDYKDIAWDKAMDFMRVRFTSAAGTASINMPLNWQRQQVVQLGMSYKMDDNITLRAGYNAGKNPIPSGNLNPLFPAIVDTHVTLGFGYVINKKMSADFSYAYSPKVSQTNAGMGATASHEQQSWQAMFSNRF